ncbi:MAG: RNA polymerase sigma factor [Elusimicrobia bacterium]|nr:RNA polymerase sigma factor [Elusimicrobiota bacterium]
MTDGKNGLPEDFDLLTEFNSGDGGAFTRIVEKHSGRLINFLFRYTLDRGEAEDLAQEAFLRLYKAAPGLTPGAKLSTILFKFAYNLAVDQARRNTNRSSLAGASSLDSPEAAGAADPAPGPDAAYEAARRSEEIAGALAGLPDTQRGALLLKVFEDRSYAEIAEIMALSVPAVESLLFRARQTLAKKLK